MKTVNFRIRGIAPLLMHNGQTADPLNEYAIRLREISAKRKKTAEDHEEMANLEWEAGLYLDGEGKIVLPSFVIEATLNNAAKKLKMGKQALSGLSVVNNSQLIFEGPEDISDLSKDSRFRLRTSARIQNSRVMRTRPLFPLGWEASFDVTYDPGTFNERQVSQIVHIAGDTIGICDWRPKFGRFEILEA